jgi:hypothetical protein
MMFTKQNPTKIAFHQATLALSPQGRGEGTKISLIGDVE